MKFECAILASGGVKGHFWQWKGIGTSPDSDLEYFALQLRYFKVITMSSLMTSIFSQQKNLVTPKFAGLFTII